MGFASFHITLDNPSEFFSPGQTVNGNVHITNNQVESLKGIHVESLGGAEVRFPGKERKQESSNNSTSPATDEFYYEEEQYFSFQYSLHNSGCPMFDLDIGQHEYPFTFVLPTQIPSSFEGEFGHVRYIIRAVAQCAFQQSEYDCYVHLTVCSNLDLNTIPGAALPVSKMQSKKLCCLCCASGPISAQARIERTGYVPGETIILNADTENHSGKPMQGSKAELVQITKFLAEGQTKSDSRILELYSHDGFTDSDIMENVALVIPPGLPPSDLPFCRLISVSYQIQYIVDPGTFAVSLTVPLDVIIGTVPLYNSAAFAPGITDISNQHIGFPPVAGVLPNTSPQPVGFNPWAVPNWQGGGSGAPTAPPPE